jgi:hypothetical protein
MPGASGRWRSRGGTDVRGEPVIAAQTVGPWSRPTGCRGGVHRRGPRDGDGGVGG